MSAFFLAALLVPCCGDEKPVHVTVVIVLATDKNASVDPKLKELAKEVQKRDPKLTGFKLVATECKSIPVGDTATINLTDKQVLKLTVDQQKDKDGRISLTLNPPGMDAVTYACACDKFFPVVTPHRTKSGEQLLIAVMAKPCTAKK
ncbi:hypothetical protein [Frigoriglobus tundricola]|uniref:Uncharacterized protein n=1 Tax=Frigoriglobus tundricola TaxID=2774151 RepID=A0A6M5YJ18_9BACT|nr:hypothetical protein [Frigoriglobus tundricola]QJW93331.1 hypothetical protein FTUN_0837 [Frigoriglobus tundricola]